MLHLLLFFKFILTSKTRFGFLLQLWALISRQPAFTTDQLQALTAGDEFELIDWPAIFSVSPTPLADALRITYRDPTYSSVVMPF